MKEYLKTKITDPVEFVRKLIEDGWTDRHLPSIVEEDGKEKLFGQFLNCSRLTRAFGSVISDDYRADAVSMVAHRRGELNLPANAWWMVREALRFHYGVYERITQPGAIGELAEALGGVYATFAHVSLDGTGRLGYTASVADALKDVQRVVTFQRYLRSEPRLYCLSDHRIDAIGAQLLAYAKSELTLLPASQIPYVYEHSVESCMTHNHSRGTPYWNKQETEGHHPTEVYDAPGFSMAVVRGEDRDGEPFYSQRALVWVNPDNQDDKRCIRIYGSGMLGHLLTRNGYQMGALYGAKLKLIPLTQRAGMVVLPYMDSNGSTGGSLRVIRRRDYLQVLSIGQLQNLRDALGSSEELTMEQISVVPTSTCGIARLAEIPEDKLYVQDCLTGEKVDIMSAGGGWLTLMEGEIRRSYAEVPTGWILVSAHHQGRLVEVFVPSETPTFVHRGDRYIDLEETRQELGYTRLCEEFYKGADGGAQFVKEHQTVVTEDGYRILCEDALNLIVKGENGGAKLTVIHKAKLADRKRYMRCRSVNGLPTLVSREVGLCTVTSENGRKVLGVPLIHEDIVVAWHGEPAHDSAVNYVLGKVHCLEDLRVAGYAEKFTRAYVDWTVTEHAVERVQSDFVDRMWPWDLTYTTHVATDILQYLSGNLAGDVVARVRSRMSGFWYGGVTYSPSAEQTCASIMEAVRARRYDNDSSVAAAVIGLQKGLASVRDKLAEMLSAVSLSDGLKEMGASQVEYLNSWVAAMQKVVEAATTANYPSREAAIEAYKAWKQERKAAASAATAPSATVPETEAA